MNPKVKIGLFLVLCSVIGEIVNGLGNALYNRNEELDDYFRSKHLIVYEV